jgi:hypothetical protein
LSAAVAGFGQDSDSERPASEGGATKARMFVSQKRIVVEFGDCDPAGIVYNPQYLRWFGACSSALFANVGIPFRTIFKAHGGIGIPIVNVQGKIPAAVNVRR